MFGLQVECNHVIMNIPISFQDISLHIHVIMSYFALDNFNNSLGERGADHEVRHPVQERSRGCPRLETPS